MTVHEEDTGCIASPLMLEVKADLLSYVKTDTVWETDVTETQRRFMTTVTTSKTVISVHVMFMSPFK